MTDIDEKAIKTAIQSGGTADHLETLLDEVGAARREVLATLKGISNIDGTPGKRRQEVLEAGSVDDLKTLNAEVEIEQARLERLEAYQNKLRKLLHQAQAKEAAANISKYYKDLAKAAQKITAANQKLSEAWAEADDALKDLRQARTHALRSSTALEPADEAVSEAVQQAWACAHVQGMPDNFHSPIRRDGVAKVLGHSVRNVSLVPGANETIIV